MIKERIPEIKKLLKSKKGKKIATTAILTFSVFLFFVWLGLGMYFSVPQEDRGELWRIFIMYSIFPLLIFFFGAKRVYAILNSELDIPEDEND